MAHKPDLVKLMLKAGREPGYRPMFDRALAGATLWTPVADDGIGMETARGCLQVWDCDSVVGIPLFASLKRLKRSAGPGCPAVALEGREMLAMSIEHDVPFLLEPDEKMMVMITPPVAREMLAPEPALAPRPRLVREGEPLVMRAMPVPDGVPDRLRRSLAIAWSAHANVRRAWLALVQAWPPEANPVEPALGIDGSGDVYQALKDGALVVSAFYPRWPAMQLFDVTEAGDGDFSALFRAHGTPVYEARHIRH